jgi:CYTH domain-containing protein
MGYMVEIERKFLVNKEKLPELPTPRHLRQGYLSFGPPANVRVRLDGKGEQGKAFITIKGKRKEGRDEFEYAIPPQEATQLLTLSQGSVINKKRYILPVHNAPQLKWELDIFEGDNAGLIVAEIELPEENFPFDPPEWLGEDVTDDAAYLNANLARHPYKDWVK